MSRVRQLFQKINILDRLNILEEEHEDTIDNGERMVRNALSALFRGMVACILAWHVFDFLFNSIWMHGYIWSLNLPIDLDMSDKSAGSIVYHQLGMVGPLERIFNSVATVCSVSIILVCSGFATGEPRSVWDLFRVSCTVGALTGIVRTLQMKQRLFSSLHEGFYCYFVVFLVGLVLSVRQKQATPPPEVAHLPQAAHVNAVHPDELIEDDNNNTMRVKQE